MEQTDIREKAELYADSIIPIAKTYEEMCRKNMLIDAYIMGAKQQMI